MKNYIYKELPKLCEPNDFLGQVKRTVNGEPVSQKQIDMIIAAIKKGLRYEQADVLFDLGCGNGALSALMFPLISQYHGVDFSEYLIEIAKKNFEKPGFTFEYGEANQYLAEVATDYKYTKGLCYGVFSYLERESAINIFKNINIKFPQITRFYIGNIPDKDRVQNFFYKDIDYSKLIHNSQSNIGIWWSKEELKEWAKTTGWNIEFIYMPENFFAANYRFDVIVTKKNK